MSAPVLVVGARGNVGRACARALLDLVLHVRAAGRSYDRVRADLQCAEAVRLDLHEPTTFAPAVEGVRRMFLVRPPAVARVGPTLGRHVREEPATALGHARHLRARGLPATQVVVQTLLHLVLRGGDAERSTRRSDASSVGPQGPSTRTSPTSGTCG